MMNKKITAFVLAFLISVMTFSGLTSCKKDPAKGSSQLSSGDIGDISNESNGLEDVFSDETGTGEDESPVASADGEKPAGSTSSSSKNSGQSTPVASKPANVVTELPSHSYPNTPGETSTKKLPNFISQLPASSTITFLCSAEYGDDAKAMMEAFKTKTGKELIFKYDVVEWSKMQNILATRVKSNNAPDLFIYDGCVTPYLAAKSDEYFYKISDYINMNDALWKDMQGISLLGFGKNNTQYAVATSAPNVTQMVLYNKTLFEDAELEDPMDLYNKGKWTWDAFYEATKELTVDKNHDGTPEVLVASMPDYSFAMFCQSTGNDFATFNNDGTLKSDLKNPNFQRAAAMINKIGKISLDAESWNYTTRFSQNKIGMVIAGPWTTTSGALNKMKKDGKIGFVPLPKDPQSDKYYMQGSVNFSFIPKGAKNAKATAAWLYWQRSMEKNPNPAMEKKNLAISKEKWGWTEAEYNLVYKELKKNINFIIAYADRVPDFDKQAYLWGMPFKESWTQTLNQVEPSFNKAINAFNKSLK